MNKREKNKTEATPQFEEYLMELQQIISELETGNVSLSDSLQKYETGVQRLKQCFDLLGSAEKRVELLSGVDAEGNLVTEAFDESADNLDTKARTRSQRRSRAESKPQQKSKSTAAGDDIDDPLTLF